MILNTYLNTPTSFIYSSPRYLNIIRNHKNIIIDGLSPRNLNDQEIGFYRHRLHAYLLDNFIPWNYHLPIMALNDLQSEFDFGLAKNNILNNNVISIYIPLLEVFDDYAKKIKIEQG